MKIIVCKQFVIQLFNCYCSLLSPLLKLCLEWAKMAHWLVELLHLYLWKTSKQTKPNKIRSEKGGNKILTLAIKLSNKRLVDQASDVPRYNVSYRDSERNSLKGGLKMGKFFFSFWQGTLKTTMGIIFSETMTVVLEERSLDQTAL